MQAWSLTGFFSCKYASIQHIYWSTGLFISGIYGTKAVCLNACDIRGMEQKWDGHLLNASEFKKTKKFPQLGQFIKVDP